MNQVNEIIEKYYSLTYGYMKEEYDEALNIVIYYLLDNKYTKEDVLRYLFKHGTELVDELWSNSLLRKNIFYYHSILRLLPSTSIWNPNIKERSSKFYLEMKIQFSLDDLLNYYYNELKIPIVLRDENKDKGGLKFLLKKYSQLNIESIDFILFLIDYNKSENVLISNVLDMQKYEREVYERITYMIDNSIYKNIIWRGAK